LEDPNEYDCHIESFSIPKQAVSDPNNFKYIVIENLVHFHNNNFVKIKNESGEITTFGCVTTIDRNLINITNDSLYFNNNNCENTKLVFQLADGQWLTEFKGFIGYINTDSIYSRLNLLEDRCATIKLVFIKKNK
jgi:hypothetical protein